jgi:glycosidase
MPNAVFGPDVDAVLREAAVPGERLVPVGGTGVRIATPFPSPGDWRDRWIYFVLLDRFDNPAAAPRFAPWDGDHGVFQGGTLEGVRRRLPYLADLGVGALWLSPVLKNCQWKADSYHGYGIQDFLRVEPRFTSDPAAARLDPRIGDDELRRLVDAAHAHGLHVILDVVINHAGDVFDYVGRGAEAPWKGGGPEYDVRWRDATGQPVPAWPEAATIPAPRPPEGVVWPQELQRNDYWRRRGREGEGAPETVGDFGSLKEIVTEYLKDGRFPVRELLIRAHQYLIAKFDVDGFRIDTLKYVEEDFARTFGGAIREFALSLGKTNFFTFGEVWESTDEAKIARFIGRNTEKDDEPIGIDAALDFPLFTRLTEVIKGSGAPAALDAMFAARRAAHRHLLASHGEAGRFFVTFLDNHDLNSRFYWSPPGDPHRWDDQLTLALGCLFTLQGIPCLYYGTEQGLHGAGNRREAAREALWGKPGTFDPAHPFYRAVQTLARLRQAEPALRYGRQYFRPVSGNGADFGVSATPGGVLAFSRILHDRELLVAANTHTTEGRALDVVVDRDLTPAGAAFEVLYANRPGPAAPGTASARGDPRSVRVSLKPLEIQILAKRR